MAPFPINEAERMDALHRTQLLDTAATKAFDDLTHLAAHLCGVPIAAVTLVDSERQWFKSILGLDIRETPRSAAFCAHTILEPDLLVVPDAVSDERFRDNPLVTGDPGIRFYAGAPLLTSEGYALGALCVIDRVPRELTEEQKDVLRALGRQAATQIELSRRLAEQCTLIAEHDAMQSILQRNEMRLLEAQRIAKIGSWEFDVGTGRITWSPEMFRLLDFDPAQGEPDYETLMTHYHPDDVAMHMEIVQKALQDGLPYEFDIRILGRNSATRWGHAVGQAARDETGQVVRLHGTVMDITERKQAEEENARLAAIMESTPDAVLGLTMDGTLVSWNAGAERIYGYSASEIIGQHASVLAPPDQQGFVASVIQALVRGTACENLEVRRQRKDGVRVNVVMTFSPIRSPGGEMIGIAAIGRDVTAQRFAEEAVRLSEARLAEAQRIAHLGSWELDAEYNEIIFSQEMFRLFDLDGTEAVPLIDQLLARYHPDDVPAHQAVIAQACIDGLPFESEMRIVRPSGEIRWCHVMGEPILGAQGTLQRLVGTMRDTTEQKAGEERFRVLFECSSEAHFLVDESGILDCNQAALQMLHCAEKSELLGIHPVSLSPETQPGGEPSSEEGLQMAKAAYLNGSHHFEWVHRRMDGTEFPTEITLTPVCLNGKSALLSVWHDLTERKLAEQKIRDYAVILEFQKQELEQANRELSDLATTDGLTGLKNHRMFQKRLAAECVVADRHHAPLSLLLLDVDHFKQLNDTFGHPAGDAVLKQIACLLEATMRECDCIARYGGEEFVIILPQTDQSSAIRAAERCRRAIEGAAWRYCPVTASFGVSTLSLICGDSTAMIAAADQALYTAKHNGRNQVVSAGSPAKTR